VMDKYSIDLKYCNEDEKWKDVETYIPDMEMLKEVLSTQYDRGYLEEIDKRAQEMMSLDVVDYEVLAKLMIDLGHRSEKTFYLQDIDSNNCRSLSHMFNLFKISLHLMDIGFQIHLIEATNKDGIKVLHDIDMIASRYEEDNSLTVKLIDYCSTNQSIECLYPGVYTYSTRYGVIARKIDDMHSVLPTLSGNIKIEQENRSIETNIHRDVLCSGMRSDPELRQWAVFRHRYEYNCKIELNFREITPKSSAIEFDLCEKIMEISLDLTGDDIEEVIDDVILNRNIDDDKDVITHSHRLASFDKDSSKTLSAIRENTVSSAKTYMEMINTAKKSDKASRDYQVDFVTDIMTCRTKPDIQVPRIHHLSELGLVSKTVETSNGEIIPCFVGKCGTYKANSNRDRIKLLMDEMELIPWELVLMSLCTDDEYHPNEEDLNDLYINGVIDKMDMPKMLNDARVKAHRDQEEDERLFVFDISKTEYKTFNELNYGKSRDPERMRESALLSVKMERKQENFITSHTMEDLEGLKGKAVDDLLSRVACSQDSELIESLIWDSLDNSKLGLIMKRTMLEDFESFKSTYLFDTICQYTEISEILAINTKMISHARQASRKDFGWNKSKIVMVAQPLSDRAGIVLSNIVFNNEKPDATSNVRVLGSTHNLKDNVFVWNNPSHRSHTFSFNRSMVDWGVRLSHVVTSFLTMEIERRRSNDPDQITSSTSDYLLRAHKKRSVLSMLTLSSNCSRFSQVIEASRYLFLNPMGMSSGTSNLVEKIKWFRPTTNLEKLYVCRMLKMSHLLELLDARNEKPMLHTRYTSKIDISMGSKTMDTLEPTICFPHEDLYLPSTCHVYDCLYDCKALSMHRGDKLTMQAQVYAKQIKSRKEYVNRQKASHNLELLYNNIGTQDEDSNFKLMISTMNKEYLKECMKKYCCKAGSGKFKANPFTVALGASFNVRENFIRSKGKDIKKQDIMDKTVGEYIDLYDVSLRIHKETVSDCFNSRGSCSDQNDLVIRPQTKCIAVKKVSKKTGKKETIYKDVPISQNDKCYNTSLINLNQSLQWDGTRAFSHQDLSADCTLNYPDPRKGEKIDDGNIYVTADKLQLDSDALKRIARGHNSLLLINLHNMANLKSLIARMVEKAQIGPREIAVLNASLRHLAKLLEDISRYIQNIELETDHTNQIERGDKDAVFDRLYRKTMRLRDTQDMGTFFDAADASTWGPSREAHIMAMTQISRVKQKSIRKMLWQMWRWFTHKVIKVPDLLADEVTNMEELESKKLSSMKAKGFDSTERDEFLMENDFTMLIKAAEDVLKMTENGLGSTENRFIDACEGMFQGVLGTSSSQEHSDAIRLRNYILGKQLQSISFNCVGVCTSDDSGSYVSFSKNNFDKLGLNVYKVANTYLKWVIQIGQDYGITRNLYKSFITEDKIEVNSKFWTRDELIDPGVKHRMSMIAYPATNDPYETAVNASSQAQEYIRTVGSTMGSVWVQILLTSMCLKQHQNVGLYKSMGKDIFKIPLELGGVIELNPLLHVCLPSCANKISNYTLDGGAKSAIDVLLYLEEKTSLHYSQNDSPEDHEKDDQIKVSDLAKSVVPSMSRSGIVFLGKRVNKTKRYLREKLLELPVDDFISLRYRGGASSLIKAMVGAFKKTPDVEGFTSSWELYRDTQVPRMKPILYMNSKLFSDILGKTKVGRGDIHSLAKMWIEMKESGQALYYSENVWVQGPDFYQITISDKTTIIPSSNFALLSSTIDSELSYYKKMMDQINPLGCTPNRRRPVHETFRKAYFRSSLVYEKLDDFKTRFLPTSMGGSIHLNRDGNPEEQLHPIEYMEVMEVLKNKLSDLQLRRQTFNFTLFDVDKKRTVFEKCLLSNFMEGSRLCFTTEMGENGKDINTDRMLTEILRILQNKVTILDRLCSGFDSDASRPYGTQVCIFDESFKKGTNMITRIDITELLKLHHNNSMMYELPSKIHTAEILSSLKVLQDLAWDRMSKIKNKRTEKPIFIVQKDQGIVSRNPQKFLINNRIMSTIEVRPADGLDGTDVIYSMISRNKKTGKEVIKYKHHVTCWEHQGHLDFVDSEFDTFDFYEFTKEEISVRLSDINGAIGMFHCSQSQSGSMRNFPISIICNNLSSSPKKIYFLTNEPDLLTLEEAKEFMENDSDQKNEIFSYKQLEEYDAYDPALENSDLKREELEMRDREMANQEIIDDFGGFSDLFDGFEIPDSMLEQYEIIGKNKEAYYGDQPLSDEMSEELSNLENSTVMSFKESSITSVQIEHIQLQNVLKVDDKKPFLESISKNANRHMTELCNLNSRVILLTIPCSVVEVYGECVPSQKGSSVEVFYDDNVKSAYSKFMADLNRKDAFDKSLIMRLFSDALKRSEIYRTLKTRINSEISSSSDTPEDEDSFLRSIGLMPEIFSPSPSEDAIEVDITDDIDLEPPLIDLKPPNIARSIAGATYAEVSMAKNHDLGRHRELCSMTESIECVNGSRRDDPFEVESPLEGRVNRYLRSEMSRRSSKHYYRKRPDEIANKAFSNFLGNTTMSERDQSRARSFWRKEGRDCPPNKSFVKSSKPREQSPFMHGVVVETPKQYMMRPRQSSQPSEGHRISECSDEKLHPGDHCSQSEYNSMSAKEKERLGPIQIKGKMVYPRKAFRC